MYWKMSAKQNLIRRWSPSLTLTNQRTTINKKLRSLGLATEQFVMGDTSNEWCGGQWGRHAWVELGMVNWSFTYGLAQTHWMHKWQCCFCRLNQWRYTQLQSFLQHLNISLVSLYFWLSRSALQHMVLPTLYISPDWLLQTQWAPLLDNPLQWWGVTLKIKENKMLPTLYLKGVNFC